MTAARSWRQMPFTDGKSLFLAPDAEGDVLLAVLASWVRREGLDAFDAWRAAAGN